MSSNDEHQSRIQTVTSGQRNKPDIPPKPSSISKHHPCMHDGPRPSPRTMLPNPRAFNDDVGRQERLSPGNSLDQVTKEICNETAEKIRSIQNEFQCHRRNLQPLRSEYTARYNRLILNVKGLPGGDDQKAHSSGVTIQTIHEIPGGAYSPVVLMVGGPGEGKTASVIQYANRAFEKQIHGPQNVQIIIFIQGKDINMNKDCTPFDLLFSKQFANILTSDEIRKELEGWVAINPSEVLVIIDGVNEVNNFSLGMNAKIGLQEASPPLTILLNILRQHIYRGMWIMCTTTPQWIWNLKKSEIPSLCIEISGFQEDEVTDILSQLTAKQQVVSEMMTRFPNVKEMCKTPAILMHLAKEIQQREALTEHQILLEILSFLDTQHAADRSTAHKRMKYMMQVAYNAAKQNRLELRVDETSNFDGDVSLAHLISAMPHAQTYSLSAEHTTNRQLLYQFHSTALRDTLAAIHLISVSSSVNSLLKDAFSKNSPAFYLLAIAFIAEEDECLSGIVMTFSRSSFQKLSNFRKTIHAHLEAKTSYVITDASWIRILNQCKGQLSQLSKVIAIKLTGDCDGNEILSVARYMPSLSKVSATKGCMIVHSSSLGLLQAKFTVKINRLRITGELQNESLTLSEVLSRCYTSRKSNSITSSVIDVVEISDYNMEYNVQARVLLVGELRHDMVSVITGLFQFIMGPKTIRVKLINMDGLTNSQIDNFLEKLNNSFKHYRLEVAELYCPGHSAVPSGILPMMLAQSKLHVKCVTFGDVTCFTSNRQVSSGACRLYLEICGMLTVSTALVSLIKTGKWNGIITADFAVVILFETLENGDRLVVSLNVNERNATTQVSYKEIIQLMTELGAGQLNFTDISVFAEYDRETDVVAKMSVTDKYPRPTPGTRYSEIAATLFGRHEDCMLEFKPLTFKKDSAHYDTTLQYENQPNIEVNCLDPASLTVLQSLFRCIELPPVRIMKCELRSCDIPRLQRLSPSISKIDQLFVEGGESIWYLQQLLHAFKCTKIESRLGNVTVKVTLNDTNPIIIGRISLEQFVNMYRELAALVPRCSCMLVETMVVPPQAQLQTLQEIFQYFTDARQNPNGIEIQIDTLITKDAPVDWILLCLTSESRFLKVASLNVGMETVVKFRDRNMISMIQVTEINRTDVHSLSKIREGLSDTRKRNTFLVEECNIPDVQNDEILMIVDELKTTFSSKDLVFDISYLYLPRFHAEVLDSLDEPLRSGYVRQLEFHGQQHRFSIGPHPAKCKSLLGVVDGISARDLKTFIEEAGEYLPTDIVVQQCAVGRDDDDITKRFAGPNDEFQKDILVYGIYI